MTASPQGLLEFDIRAPYRGMLTPSEAASALGLVWLNEKGEEKRFNNEFIMELFTAGEITGFVVKGEGPPVEYMAPVTKKEGRKLVREFVQRERAPKTRYVRISRASLMAWAAKNWNLRPEQFEAALFDNALNLDAAGMRRLAEKLFAAATARQARK